MLHKIHQAKEMLQQKKKKKIQINRKQRSSQKMVNPWVNKKIFYYYDFLMRKLSL